MIQTWIKIRDDIDTDPKVLRIARIISKSNADTFFTAHTAKTDLLGDRLETISETISETVSETVSRDVSVACLRRLWSNVSTHGRVELLNLADSKTSTACIAGDLETIGMITGMPSFGNALLKVGWLVFDKERELLFFPNFLEFNELRHLTKDIPSKNALKLRAWRAKKAAAIVSQQETLGNDLETVFETTPKPLGNSTEKKKIKNLSPPYSTSRDRPEMAAVLAFATEHSRSDTTGTPITLEIAHSWYDARLKVGWKTPAGDNQHEIKDWKADLRGFARH